MLLGQRPFYSENMDVKNKEYSPRRLNHGRKWLNYVQSSLINLKRDKIYSKEDQLWPKPAQFLIRPLKKD